MTPFQAPSDLVQLKLPTLLSATLALDILAASSVEYTSFELSDFETSFKTQPDPQPGALIPVTNIESSNFL